MKDDRTGQDVAGVGDAEGVAALVGLDAPTDPLATVPAEERPRIFGVASDEGAIAGIEARGTGSTADEAAAADKFARAAAIRREVAAWHARQKADAVDRKWGVDPEAERRLDAFLRESAPKTPPAPAAAPSMREALRSICHGASLGIDAAALADIARRALDAAPAADASLEARADMLAGALLGLDTSRPSSAVLRDIVRAVDASRPVMPERPMIDPDFAGVVWTATIKDRTEDDGPIQVGVVRDGDNYQPRFFGLGKWRDPAPDFGYRILVAWALASQPGLTEEARRAFEVACRDAAAKGGPYCITHTREAVAKLDAALLRVSRGETGQAAADPASSDDNANGDDR